MTLTSHRTVRLGALSAIAAMALTPLAAAGATAAPVAPVSAAHAQAPAQVSIQSAKKTTIRTTANLNLRSGAGVSHSVIKVLPKGTAVKKTGKTKGSWWQVTASGSTGWVASSYLKTTTTGSDAGSGAGSQHVDGLTSSAQNAVDTVYPRWSSWITSIGGYRAGSTGHSSGRAADLMIRDYQGDGVRAGDVIAKHLTDNAAALDIEYLIWQDEIWLGSHTGWVPYSTLGKYGTQFTDNWNDTTRHMDHIHVQTNH